MRAAGWLAAATALVLAAKVEDSSVPQLAELQAREYPLSQPGCRAATLRPPPRAGCRPCAVRASSAR